MYNIYVSPRRPQVKLETCFLSLLDEQLWWLQLLTSCMSS